MSSGVVSPAKSFSAPNAPRKCSAHSSSPAPAARRAAADSVSVWAFKTASYWRRLEIITPSSPCVCGADTNAKICFLSPSRPSPFLQDT